MVAVAHVGERFAQHGSQLRETGPKGTDESEDQLGPLLAAFRTHGDSHPPGRTVPNCSSHGVQDCGAPRRIRSHRWVLSMKTVF